MSVDFLFSFHFFFFGWGEIEREVKGGLEAPQNVGKAFETERARLMGTSGSEG